ncbi:response regulator [Priestia megaterium]|nr:response regulator [Priestia megaterium]
MRFCLIDDDEVIRSLLRHIIEDENLGEVVKELEDGSFIDENMLMLNQADILFIDLLMPIRDGIETVRRLKNSYSGKIIMLSQVESKELIAEAYSLGVEYYITKPINRVEVLTITRKVIERIRLEKSISDIQKSLNGVWQTNEPKEEAINHSKGHHILASSEFLLSELGIVGEGGSKDLVEIINYLYEQELNHTFESHFPSLKEIFIQLAYKRLGALASQIAINREVKATEQRVRRAVYQSLTHLASIGLTDFSNPKFESYASKFFDFTIVRKKMIELQKGSAAHMASARINTKKFIQVLYFEAKRLATGG